MERHPRGFLVACQEILLENPYLWTGMVSISILRMNLTVSGLKNQSFELGIRTLGFSRIKAGIFIDLGAAVPFGLACPGKKHGTIPSALFREPFCADAMISQRAHPPHHAQNPCVCWAPWRLRSHLFFGEIEKRLCWLAQPLLHRVLQTAPPGSRGKNGYQ